ncbi:MULTISPECIES: hypothetical protein [Lysobacter]|jgi:hypothetical protein|uniref:DUF3592 domain-containing protein n=1 Tax=Lysobacter gummosus TaxID=262324 RepID=A0ABY3XBY9_9GAMM|nr:MULTISPECIES: hypothetical protein [Lysobacter]ALN89488.1 hypothetical protein LG3211_0503 [Lysobacter gummosus]UJB18595.1 hypothetical protein L1A79_20030 [Lysobacter capsici]UJQ27680.1 hypothetical protein L2D09_19855 [Lysobacter gummosus]UNP30134.1 hypothetical protein MOV92_02315 [Lysobacter gummosus]
MSTVDPAAERRRQQIEAGPMRVAHLRLWSFVAVCAGLWGLMAYGITDAMNYGLTSSYLVPAQQPPSDTPPLLWMLFVGAFGGMILSFFVNAALDSVFGLWAGTQATFAANLTGMALGFWRGAVDRWQPPQRVGFTDPLDGAVQPWDAMTWAGWTSQYWMPTLLLLIAAALAASAMRAYRKHALRERRAREALTQGVRVPGTITELHDTGVEIYNQPRIRFVVKFTDHLGTERWVTKTGLFDPLAVPRVGDAAHVWFIADAPGEQDRIAVGFGSDEDADVAELTAGR